MSLEATLASLRELGLASLEEKIPFITDEPKIPTFHTVGSPAAEAKYYTKSVVGQGCHPNETLARIKAIGELYERLSQQNSPEGLVRGKFVDLGCAVDPAAFMWGASEDDIQTAREAVFSWQPVRQLVTGDRMLLPAQLLYLDRLFDEEFPIRKERITTGAAFGRANDTAVFERGLYESIERDATMGFYFSDRVPDRIVDLSPELNDRTLYFNRYCLEPFFFDITTDLAVPAVACITIDRTGIGPAVNVGSAAGSTYSECIEHSMLESIHCRAYSRLVFEDVCQDGYPSEDSIFCMEDRFYYWHNPQRIDDLQHWLETERTVKHEDIEKRKTNSPLEALRAKNFTPFAADISLPEMRERSYRTVKVATPQLQPLFLDERTKVDGSTHYGRLSSQQALKPHPFT